MSNEYTIWENIGDINPKEHGGIYVRILNESVEVFKIEPFDNDDKWISQYDSFDYNELLQEYNEFLQGNNNPVADSCDWNCLKGRNIDNIIVNIASDKLWYYGAESKIVTDFDKEIEYMLQ